MDTSGISRVPNQSSWFGYVLYIFEYLQAGISGLAQ